MMELIGIPYFFHTNYDDALLLELVPLDLFYEVSLIMPLYLLQ